jgi:outer membrane protein assembly factor BamB
VTAACAAALVLVASAARASTDWTTFGFDKQRTGYNPDETVLGAGNAGSLRQSWSADVGGPILTQPTVATGVALAGGRRDLVYVGTLDGVVVALDRTTGRPVWTRQLASAPTGCDNPARLGVVGTPTLDRSAHVLYLTAADGKLHALDEATGAERPGWPVTITTRPQLEFVYTSPLLLGGSLYVETASNGCDHGPTAVRVLRSTSRAARWWRGSSRLAPPATPTAAPSGARAASRPSPTARRSTRSPATPSTASASPRTTASPTGSSGSPRI